MPPKPVVNPDDFPTEVLFDIEAIRALIPQRFEMEMLSAVTRVDAVEKVVIGYKDVTHQEFWIRGHMPDFPLMPGVLMCEAAAQLCSVYSRHIGLLAGDFIAFGGMDEVRFRGAVRPGQRLWLAGKTAAHSNRRMVFEIQGFVDKKIVFNGQFIGVPMSKTPSSAATESASEG